MSGRVSLILLDNGATAVQVPTQNTQLIIGCSSTGTVGAPYASTSPQNIATNFGWGPLPEAMAMVAAVGGTAIGIRATTTTTGSVFTPVFTGTGTSVMTVTGNANDTYQIVFTCTLGGTIGTGPIAFTISLDNGRTVSPVIQLGTANSYLIPGTGLTLHFAVGTLVTGDVMAVGTVEPLWNDAGIQAAINAFLASVYGKQGVGSIHIVGGSQATLGGATGSDMTAIGGYLQSAAASQYVFARAYMSARDAKQPIAFGGIGETEAAWMGVLNADHPAQSLSKDTTGRTAVCAAYWNMTGNITNPLGFIPRFRRSVAFALAQRQVKIPPQRMPSRVKDGALTPIVIAAADKSDGWVYHDESISPGLDTLTGGAGGNFTTTTTIQGKQGVFCQHANLFGPTGSQYGYMPQGLVADILCSIAYETGVTEIDDDVRTNPTNGTIDPRDAASISQTIQTAVKVNMTNAGMLVASPQFPDGCSATIDQTVAINVPPANLPITVIGKAKSYIIKETISVGLG